jgi:hypothetical protein
LFLASRLGGAGVVGATCALRRRGRGGGGGQGEECGDERIDDGEEEKKDEAMQRDVEREMTSCRRADAKAVLHLPSTFPPTPHSTQFHLQLAPLGSH